MQLFDVCVFRLMCNCVPIDVQNWKICRRQRVKTKAHNSRNIKAQNRCQNVNHNIALARARSQKKTKKMEIKNKNTKNVSQLLSLIQWFALIKCPPVQWARERASWRERSHTQYHECICVTWFFVCESWVERFRHQIENHNHKPWA